MVITSAINIDMQYKYVNTYVDAVQYDVNSRNVEITLLKAGSRADIPTGSTFEVKFKRPDGSSGSYSELSNGQAAVTKKETNVIVVWLSEFILSEAGATVVSVCVKDGETEVNTFSFIVNVQESPHIGTGLARMYPNTYDATATPSDIAIGKTAYVNGEKILGTSVQADDENVDLTGYATEQWVQEGFQPKGNYALKTEIPAVPVQSVNGKTGAVALNASDVGARPSNWMPSASDVGALPASTTFPVTSVNGRTGDVKLTAELVGARPYNWLPTAADIGALPASTKIPTKVSELKNDAGYLTEVPEEYAKKEDIPTKPSDIGAVATVNGVAPDEHGNVKLASSTSWDDITSKPFGDKYGDTFTWDGNIYGLTGKKFSYDFAGRLYNVTRWDYEGPTVEEFRRATITMVSDTGWEQEYTDFTVLDSNSGVHGIEILTTDSSGTAFPLLVYLPDTISGPTGSYTSGLYLLRTDAGAWVKTITIPGCTKLIKTEHLNAKYLPEVEAIGDVWVKDLKERIGAGAGDGDGAVSTVNGVAPDANGNVEIVTSWYDLEDRPFGETVSDTVTWDGNTEGRSSSKFGYDSYHCTYYKVCDIALPLEEFVGQAVNCIYVNASGDEGPQNTVIYENGDLIVGGRPPYKAFFVYSPGEGVFLPKDDAPSYAWIKSITIEGYNGFLTGLKKLDEKYLPDKYLPDGVVKSVNGTAPDENGNVVIEAGGSLGAEQMEALVTAVKATFTTETFTFTLEGGEVVTKEVYVR